MPQFTDKNGKLHRAITYKSDFELYYTDGRHLTIDVKGMLKPMDSLKTKLLLHRYPELNFEVISYSKIDGGWVPLGVIQRGRKERKKAKRALS